MGKIHGMRKLMVVAMLTALALSLAGAALAADASIPNLVGTWNSSSLMVKATGITQQNSGQYIITAQEGRGFQGYKTWTSSSTGTVRTESFVGVIGPDNKTLLIAEAEDGSHSGEIIPYGSGIAINMLYGESGSNYHAMSILLTKAQ